MNLPRELPRATPCQVTRGKVPPYLSIIGGTLPRGGDRTHTSDQTDPLAQPGVVRIALSERTTQALLEVGEAFVIVGRGSYPLDAGRMAVYLKPCPLKVAADACKILAGTHRATRCKPAKLTQ